MPCEENKDNEGCRGSVMGSVKNLTLQLQFKGNKTNVKTTHVLHHSLTYLQREISWMGDCDMGIHGTLEHMNKSDGYRLEKNEDYLVLGESENKRDLREVFQ